MRPSFNQMILGCYGMFYWRFSSDDRLMDYNINNQSANDLLPLFTGRYGILGGIKQYTHALPFLYEDHEQFFWIVCPHKQSPDVSVYGPIAIGERQVHQITAVITQLTVKHLTSQQLTALIKCFNAVPLNQLFSIARECFYQVDCQVVAQSQIMILSTPTNKTAEMETIHQLSAHQDAYLAETAIFNCVKQGKVNYQSVLSSSSQISNGVKTKMGTLCQARLSILTLNFICSRAAIAGGVPSTIIYTVADRYAEECINLHDRASLQALGNTLLSDYVTRVYQLKNKHHRLTPPVAACKEFIDISVRNKIDLKSLTAVSGYSYYYLSHEFNRQVGCSITDYINQTKIQTAKRLLKTSKWSSSEIAANLHFSSPSYFSTVFRKYTGISPQIYRQR